MSRMTTRSMKRAAEDPPPTRALPPPAPAARARDDDVPDVDLFLLGGDGDVCGYDATLSSVIACHASAREWMTPAQMIPTQIDSPAAVRGPGGDIVVMGKSRWRDDMEAHELWGESWRYVAEPPAEFLGTEKTLRLFVAEDPAADYVRRIHAVAAPSRNRIVAYVLNEANQWESRPWGGGAVAEDLPLVPLARLGGGYDIGVPPNPAPHVRSLAVVDAVRLPTGEIAVLYDSGLVEFRITIGETSCYSYNDGLVRLPGTAPFTRVYAAPGGAVVAYRPDEPVESQIAICPSSGSDRWHCVPPPVYNPDAGKHWRVTPRTGAALVVVPRTP